jgi:hypothetical protein
MKLRRKREAEAGRKACRRAALKLVVAAVICALGAPPALLAGKKKEKPQRMVMGIVHNDSEAPIVGAVVEMTDVQTGKRSVMYSQDGGHYQFSGLNAGHDYKIQATYKGISSEVRTASSFDTRNTIRLNLQIPPPKDENE